MDACERKNTWISLEDEFWEIEARWQWLHKKVKFQMENNHESEVTSQNSEQNEILSDGVLGKKTQSESLDDCETEEDINLSYVCRLQSIPDLLNPFCQYCKDVYDAVRHTTSTMSTVKEVMWKIWDNDTICESFYDAIQFSQQLLENLSTCWSIAFSLFRSQELDLLYRSEKLATQSSAAHQVSLKFIMSCWQTYLAAYPHSMTAQLNQARTKVKENGHSVGHAFSKPIVSSHAFTVAIARALQKITAKKMNSSRSKMNIEKIRLSETTDVSDFICKDEPPQKSAQKLEKVEPNVQAKVQNPKDQFQTSKKKIKEIISPAKELLAKDTQPATKHPQTEKLQPRMDFEEPQNYAVIDMDQPQNELTKRSVPVIDKDGKRVIFMGVNPQKEIDDEPEKNPRKRIFSGTRYPVRCEVNSLYKPADPQEPTSESGPSNQRTAAKELGQQRKRKVQKKKHDDDESESICSRCKCCYEADKHQEMESITSASSPSATTSSCLSSTEENDRDDLSMASNEVAVTSGCQPEFKIQEWEAFLVDVMDLQKEWETLSENLTSSSLESKLKFDNAEIGEEAKTTKAKESYKSDGSSVLEGDEKETFQAVLKDLINSMNEALTLSASEIKNHIKHWVEREKKNELRLHMKGYDPNEAILQAKSFLFQLMQSFFSMLLLSAADNDRRVLCYAALLPESIAESRKFAYNLMLSRELPNQKRLSNETKRLKKPENKKQSNHPSSTVSPNPSYSSSNRILNPHFLCQHLAMALCKAHFLSGKFITLVSKVID